MTSYCHNCKRETRTAFLPLSSGHIGNCCAVCRTTRKGRPYVSKCEYEMLNTPIAERPEGESQPTTTIR